ncbi:hypothetical protein RDJLphi1_gp31 [Roseobacter phage RDJL Phi 1]|uniref:Uncharacterized protein n=1 Tax=Roseobacter phage RDJL Phi 1 TaxID=562742 RepID=F4YXP2_9CAUD|nr:hypothetical protein RDJLphi1_gp31 [Roseobacter phage RDJL Phi 1]ADK73432.1 hypothetical protein RDJLphi1_gp31 [Roseobacter phage RDJL Phi 1]
MKKIMMMACALALIGAPVMAQNRNCAPRDAVVERLQSKYAEAVHARGLAANGTMLEVWGSNESGSWTVTITTPQGLTCLVASGQSFEDVEPEPIVNEGDPT